MKRNKFKLLIFFIAFFVWNMQFDVFAEGGNSNINPSQNPNTTTLDGEIGEWDPNINNAPDFDQVTDIEGSIPNEGEYFTISVTVPLDMNFYVLHSTTLAFGSFYSPEYTIKNNGTKTVVTKVNSFSMENAMESDTNAPLYIEEVIGGDNRTQMELRLYAVDNLDSNGNLKQVDLTKIGTLSDEDKVLCEIQTNETKKIKFTSDNWEIPRYESNKKTASSSYIAGFEFSIKE